MELEAGNCNGAGLTLPAGGVNLTVFVCPNDATLSDVFLEGLVGNYSCSGGENSTVFIRDDTRAPQLHGPQPGECNYVSLPVSAASLDRSGSADARTFLANVLEDGFSLQWDDQPECVSCENTGGRCGYDSSSGRVVCFCKGKCKDHTGHSRSNWKLIVGATIGSTFALLALVLLLRFKYWKRISTVFKSLSGKNPNLRDAKHAKEFIKTYQSTILTSYPFSDLKKMTNGFKEKLGEGGCGKVFKGKLPDGRFVAVKILEKYRGDSQTFLNEVTTIGYIHHVNVIRLFGFCWDGPRQALVYEYMPKKSLRDAMSHLGTSPTLGLTKLLEIAIGVANGLHYLHNGCESRILHLDIKPHNVLLDDDFNPKISDFGLAKVYSRDESAVTMTGARGTIGYIAPEMFMTNLGKPSDKADVYSFGMLLLEMVGAKEYVEPIESSSSEAIFPGWVYDKLVQGRDLSGLNDHRIGDEVSIERKLAMVGLWCIEVNPRHRPSMARVIEMLMGSVEGIEMPPRPFSFSLPRLQVHQETVDSLEGAGCELPLSSGSLETQ